MVFSCILSFLYALGNTGLLISYAILEGVGSGKDKPKDEKEGRGVCERRTKDHDESLVNPIRDILYIYRQNGKV